MESNCKELCLKLLVEHHGQVLSRAQILDHIIGPEHENHNLSQYLWMFIIKQLQEKNYCWIVSLLLKMSDIQVGVKMKIKTVS